MPYIYSLATIIRLLTYHIFVIQCQRAQYMYEVILSRDAKARAIMVRLAELGPNLHRPHADIVRGKIRELRCGIGTFEQRLFFSDAIDGERK